MKLISLIIIILSNLIIYSVFEKSSFKGGLIFRVVINILILYFEGIFSSFSKIINENGLGTIAIIGFVFVLYCVVVNAVQFLIYNRTRSFFSFLLVSEIVSLLFSFFVNYLFPTIF